MSPVKLVNTIRTKKDRSEEVLVRFSTPKSATRAEGFIRMEVLLNTKNSEYDEIKICTNWETKKHFNAWFTSEESVANHKRAAEETQHDNPIIGNDVSIFEVQFEHYPTAAEKI